MGFLSASCNAVKYPLSAVHLQLMVKHIYLYKERTPRLLASIVAHDFLTCLVGTQCFKALLKRIINVAKSCPANDLYSRLSVLMHLTWS